MTYHHKSLYIIFVTFCGRVQITKNSRLTKTDFREHTKTTVSSIKSPMGFSCSTTKSCRHLNKTEFPITFHLEQILSNKMESVNNFLKHFFFYMKFKIPSPYEISSCNQMTVLRRLSRRDCM